MHPRLRFGDHNHFNKDSNDLERVIEQEIYRNRHTASHGRSNHRRRTGRGLRRGHNHIWGRICSMPRSCQQTVKIKMEPPLRLRPAHTGAVDQHVSLDRPRRRILRRTSSQPIRTALRSHHLRHSFGNPFGVRHRRYKGTATPAASKKPTKSTTIQPPPHDFWEARPNKKKDCTRRYSPNTYRNQ
jgi:hypothetical protein